MSQRAHQEAPDARPAESDAPESVEESGRALDALRGQVFRRVYTGAFFSNVGTWMQNVVLGALAWDLTGSSTFVGLILFAQLGPMLFFSMVGGLLADTFDRRHLLIVVSATQALLSLGLAAVTTGDDPHRTAILGIVFLIGIGQSVFGPTYSAVLPDIAGPGNLAGAISLNSAQMNGARVIGPALAGFMFATWGASWVFIVNAGTFLFVIAALLSVRLPRVERPVNPEPRLRRMALGFRIARDRHPVGRSLAIMVVFSFLCLPFVGQLPVLADQNLGIAARSTTYGWLFAAFGLGAMLGALSIGTVFASMSKEQLVRYGMVAFALSLGVFSWLRTPEPGFVVLAIVGFFYFGTVTSLATVLQMHLANRERGRVMALWMMAFGGVVPIGNLVAGPIIDATSVTTVVFPGAIVALFLAWWADLAPRPDAAEVNEDPGAGPFAKPWREAASVTAGNRRR